MVLHRRASAIVRQRHSPMRSPSRKNNRGHARSADVDRKADRLEYNIETVRVDGTLHKMRVSATDGKVIADEAEK